MHKQRQVSLHDRAHQETRIEGDPPPRVTFRSDYDWEGARRGLEVADRGEYFAQRARRYPDIGDLRPPREVEMPRHDRYEPPQRRAGNWRGVDDLLGRDEMPPGRFGTGGRPEGSWGQKLGLGVPGGGEKGLQEELTEDKKSPESIEGHMEILGLQRMPSTRGWSQEERGCRVDEASKDCDWP